MPWTSAEDETLRRVRWGAEAAGYRGAPRRQHSRVGVAPCCAPGLEWPQSQALGCSQRGRFGTLRPDWSHLTPTAHQLVALHGPKKWSLIAHSLPTKGSKQCRRRWQNYLNNTDAKSGGWTADEVRSLLAPGSTRGAPLHACGCATGRGVGAAGPGVACTPGCAGRVVVGPRLAVPQLFLLLHCLQPDACAAGPQDKLLMEGHAQWGNRWTEIAKMVVGRTDNGAPAFGLENRARQRQHTSGR